MTGATRQGYQINTSTNSYVIYDRLGGYAVKRVSSGMIEQGVFEYRMALKKDGTVGLDYSHPIYLSKGNIYYTTPQGGRATFSISEKNIQEIKIDVPSPDITLDPSTTKDSTNKILNGPIHILALGLELMATNGKITKSSGQSLSSQELTGKIAAAFIFGNGFNNQVVPVGTPDTLMPPFINNLIGDGVVNTLRTFLVTMYGPTNFVGNLLQWFSNYVIPTANLDPEVNRFATMLNDPAFFLNLMLNHVSSTDIPAALKASILDIQNSYNAYFGGLNKSLANDVFNQLINLERANGPISDGIAFAHSGFFEPLLKAIQTQKSDGTLFDINTIINYEGPYWLSHSDTINNPNLKRIINVWGSVGLPGGAPPTWSVANANFQGPGGIDNVNIEIIGAMHNDFSYNPSDYADHTDWNDAKANRQRINRRVNLFMRDLYQAALTDQTNPGDLNGFFDRLVKRNAAKKVNGVWQIDPDNLRDIQLS